MYREPANCLQFEIIRPSSSSIISWKSYNQIIYIPILWRLHDSRWKVAEYVGRRWEKNSVEWKFNEPMKAVKETRWRKKGELGKRKNRAEKKREEKIHWETTFCVGRGLSRYLIISFSFCIRLYSILSHFFIDLRLENEEFFGKNGRGTEAARSGRTLFKMCGAWVDRKTI